MPVLPVSGEMFTCLSPGAIKMSVSWEEAAVIAAEVGFQAIEVPAPFADDGQSTAATLNRLGLRCGGYVLHTASLRGDDAAYQTYRRSLPRQASILHSLKGRTALTWLLPYSDTRPYRENFQWHVERLKPVAAIMGEHDCTLAVEFVGPRSARDGHRYPFIHTLEQALELCHALGPNAGLLLDSWHWHTSLSTLDDLRMLSNDQVQYVHVNDAPRGIPFDQYQDLSRALPGATGVIDIGAFFAELRRMNYAGPIVAEPFDASLAARPAAEAARQTIQSLRQAMNTPPRPTLPRTMKVLAVGQRKARLVDQPVPMPVGNEVLIKMHAALICGSNMDQFHGDVEKINGGHEGAGEVVAVAQSLRLRVGDRVALAPMTSCGVCRFCLRGDVLLCRQRPKYEGTFGQYVRVSDTVCIPLPDDISYEHGALLGCALGPAYGALKAIGVRAFDTLVVTGLGPVGIGVCALATFMNIRVVAIDPVPGRRDIARQIGVAHLHGSANDADLRPIIGGFGSSFGIDCTGRGEAQRLLIDLAAPQGQVVFIGENKGDFILHPSADCIRKQLIIRGIWHMNMNDVDDLIVFLRRRPDLADLILTHRFPFDRAQDAFDVFAARQGVKVALVPC